MLGRTDSRRRLLVLLVVFVVGSLALTARLAYWQVVDRERLASEAMAQTTVNLETPSKRGDVFDRTGTIVLATTVPRERLVADPAQLTPDQRRQTVAELTRILGLNDVDSIALRDRLTSDSKYLILRYGLERAVADQIRAALVDQHVFGLTLEPEPERVYPQVGGGPGSTLAAHLLGFVNREGIGQYGVEQAYQSALAGEPRVLVTQRDASGQPIIDEATVSQPGVPGQDLRLTIDAGLQLKVEQELLAAWVADRAKRVSAVVMDPYTGEIYGMATYPSYDANDYKAIATSDPGRFIDPMVSTVYEPGSVFKMMTAAAALEAGTVTPSTRIKDVGTLRLDKGKTKIDDADRKGMGWLSFEDGVAYSRNVVAAKVALGLGQDDPRIVGHPARHVAPARLWPAERHRRRGRGRRPGARPGGDSVARDRPRQRRIRTGRRGHADPAGAGVRGPHERRDAGRAARREVGRRSRPAGRADDQGDR